MKRFLIWTLLLVMVVGIFSIFSFSSAHAQNAELGRDVSWTGIVPCGRSSGTDAEQAQCTLCHLIVGIQRLFTYGVSIIIAVALAAFFIAGIMYMVSAGNQEAMNASKKFMLTSMIAWQL